MEENKNNPAKLWSIMKEVAPSNFAVKDETIAMSKDTINKISEHFASTGKRIQQQIENEGEVADLRTPAEVNTTASLDKIDEAKEEVSWWKILGSGS